MTSPMFQANKLILVPERLRLGDKLSRLTRRMRCGRRDRHRVSQQPSVAMHGGYVLELGEHAKKIETSATILLHGWSQSPQPCTVPRARESVPRHGPQGNESAKPQET